MKTYRREYSLIEDFSAAHVDECHRPVAQAKVDDLNSAAISDGFAGRKEAQYAGCYAILNSGAGQVVTRCNVKPV